MHEADDASSTSVRDAVIDRLLAECHNNFQETKNKYFVWQAIDYCSPAYWGHSTDIPEWCFEPLFEAAHEITAPIRKILSAEAKVGACKPSSKEWKRMLERLPGALGLSRQGKNQFRNALSAMRSVQKADVYHISRAAKGNSAKEAIDEVKEATGQMPGGNTTPADRDPHEDRRIFAEVAKGVRLSTGGKAPPRRRSGKAKVNQPPG